MAKQHTEDYKRSAVKYALKIGNQVETCRVFDCKRQSLQRWMKTYKNKQPLARKTRMQRSYKVRQSHIDFIRRQLRKKPEIFMPDLKNMLEQQFPNISISREHLAKLIRYNHMTRKRLRFVHVPTLLRGKERNHKKEVDDYIEEARKHDIDKIICLDETAIYANLHPSYARCNSGKRCYKKTTDNRIFKKYSLLVAIHSTGTIAWELYEKGAVNSERLTKFIKEKINPMLSNNLVIMDNAMFHKTNDVKDAVKEGNNTLLYTVAYYPRSNPIEQYFSQLKHYIKKESPIVFDDIKRVIQSSIQKIQEKNYKNYFLHAFQASWLTKTRKQKRVKKLFKSDEIVA